MNLATAIALADKARSDYVARCLDVWHLVELADPVRLEPGAGDDQSLLPILFGRS